MAPDNKGVVIVYDGECPFCTRYVRLLRLKESFGQVTLVDARSEDPWATEARRLFDIDEGMATLVGGTWYFGADSIHILALASGGSSFLNRAISWVFSDPKRAATFYPGLRLGRNTVLKLMGRSQIGDSGRER